MMLGPFDLKNIIIALAIIVATTTAMYLLKGVLSLAIALPIWLLVTIFVSIAAIMFLFIATIFGYFRWGKEGFLFAQARKAGLPIIIDAELGSDNADFVLGEKANPKDVIFKDEESGVKIDPSLLSSDARPLRFPLGLDVYIYSFYNFMPQSIRNTAAFKAIETYFFQNCKELTFLSIKEFCELISDPEHFLEHDCLIKLNKYFKLMEKINADGTPVLGSDKKPTYIHVRQFQGKVQKLDQQGIPVTDASGNVVMVDGWIEQDLSLTKMIQLVAQARDDIARLPIMGGYLAGTEAFKNNSVAYSSQHFSHALMLYLKKINDEWMKKLDFTTLGMAALMICGGITIILAVIFVLGGGSK
jgi:hypothetical protein